MRPTTFEFRRWDDGRLLSATPLGDAIERSYGAPYLHAHRADLVAVLAAAVPAERVEVGRRCVGVEHHDGPPRSVSRTGPRRPPTWWSGRTASTPRCARRSSATSGRRSPATWPTAGSSPPSGSRRLDRRCTVRLGPGAHLVHYFVSAGRYLNVVCITEEGAWTRESWTDRGDVAELRAAFARLAPGRPGDHRGAGRAAEVGAVRPRPVPAVEPGCRDPARRRLPPDAALRGAGRGPGDRGRRRVGRVPHGERGHPRRRWPATSRRAGRGRRACRRSRGATANASTCRTGRASRPATRRWRRASAYPPTSTGCTGTDRPDPHPA